MDIVEVFVASVMIPDSYVLIVQKCKKIEVSSSYSTGLQSEFRLVDRHTCLKSFVFCLSTSRKI
jgi:hypothetical protein